MSDTKLFACYARSKPRYIVAGLTQMDLNIFEVEKGGLLKQTTLLNQTYVTRVYDTIMSIPGMAEKVKIDMRLTRKIVLLLSALIKRGLSAKSDVDSSLPEGQPKGILNELDTFADECLVKSG